MTGYRHDEADDPHGGFDASESGHSTDEDLARIGCRSIRPGAEAVLLGRTGNGKYAVAMLTLPVGPNGRPVVRTMSAAQAASTLFGKDPIERACSERRRS